MKENKSALYVLLFSWIVSSAIGTFGAVLLNHHKSLGKILIVLAVVLIALGFLIGEILERKNENRKKKVF